MFHLLFYRRVGEAPLRLEDLERVMAGLPAFTRDSQPAEAESQEVRFLHEGTEAEGGFEFRFKAPSPDAEESPGRADFPFEVTPLELRMAYLQRREDAEAAMEMPISPGCRTPIRISNNSLSCSAVAAVYDRRVFASAKKRRS